MKGIIIGFGNMGQNHHERYKKLNVDIIGIVDNEETKRDMANHLGIKSYAALTSCLQDSEMCSIDFIDICLPTDLHFNCIQQIIEKFKDRPIPVIVEKPIVRTATEADKLAELAKSYPGIIHLEEYLRVVRLANDIIQLAKYKERKNAGLFGLLPAEILLAVTSQLNCRDLIKLTRTGRYLKPCFAETLTHPTTLLDLMSNMSAHEILGLKDNYFRPVCNVQYQNLKNQLPTELNNDNDYIILLCYALLTDNVTELNSDPIEKLFHWLNTNSHHAKYGAFIPCIREIMHILKNEYKKFTDNVLFHGKIEPCYEHVADLDHFYYNFAGVSFPAICSPNFKIHSADFRACNLENTKWNWLHLENCCFAGANLENADFNNAYIQECNFWLSNCKNTSFFNSCFYNTEPRQANFEGAAFHSNPCFPLANAKGSIQYIPSPVRFHSCNVNGITLFTALRLFEFIDCNIETVKILQTTNFDSDLSLSKRLKRQLDFYFQPDSDCNIKKHVNGNALRPVIAKNVVDFIKQSELDPSEKLKLVKDCIAHPLFADAWQGFRTFERSVMGVFVKNYEATPKYRQILLSFRDDLQKQIHKDLAVKPSHSMGMRKALPL